MGGSSPLTRGQSQFAALRAKVLRCATYPSLWKVRCRILPTGTPVTTESRANAIASCYRSSSNLVLVFYPPCALISRNSNDGTADGEMQWRWRVLSVRQARCAMTATASRRICLLSLR